MPNDLDDASKAAKQTVEEIAQPALQEFAGQPRLAELFPALCFQVEQPQQDGDTFFCCCRSLAPGGRAIRGGPIVSFRITASATAKAGAVVALSVKAEMLGTGEREWKAIYLPRGAAPLPFTAALNDAKQFYPEQLANCAAAIAEARLGHD